MKNNVMSTNFDPSISRRNRFVRHVLYALVISGIAVIASYHSVLPVFRSHLKDYLGIGDAGFGLLFSIGTLPGIITVLFGGQLIDRWGPRRVIRICLIGISCSMLVAACAGQHLWPFLLSMMLAGIFSGSLFIAISAYLAKLFPKHKRKIISLSLVSTSISGMLFPLLAEGLLALPNRYASITFQHTLHWPFLLAGCLLLALSFVYRRPGAISKASVGALLKENGRPWDWRDMLLPQKTFVLAALIALHGTVDSVLYIWMARFLESSSFSNQTLKPGIVLSGYSLAYLISRAILTILPDKMGRRTLMIVPGILGGSILFVGILSRSYFLTTAGYVIGALCWSVEYPAVITVLLSVDRRRFGAAMAMSGVMASIFMFIAINMMGLVVDRIGGANMWIAMLALPCGFVVFGLGSRIWLRVYEGDAKTEPNRPIQKP